MPVLFGIRLVARIALFVMIVCVFVVTAPNSRVSAATSVELNAPIKTDFDTTVASIADKHMAAKLSSLYGDLDILLKQDKTEEAKINALHYRNEDALIALRKQIREIDADNLSKLGSQVKTTKDRYKPLFEAYTLVNKQITIARSLKNKTLSSLLRTQAGALKLSVQYAREDIKAKEAMYSSAKSVTARTIKTARGSLEAIDPLAVQIKAQRSAAKLPRGSLAPVWTNFKYAIKKRQANGTQDALSTLVMLSRQIVDQQQKIYALEVRICDIIALTKARHL